MQKNQHLPFLAAFAGMVSVQTGAAFAKTLFPVIGSEGVAALRLGISSLVLLAVFRPWTLRNSEVSWGAMALYGVVLALMNLLIYRAFAYIPVSIAISIEVMGPLIAALLTSRQKTDLLWILLSASGLFLLAAGDIYKVIDIRGVAYSLAAAFFWGLYVIVGRSVSNGGGRSVAAGMTSSLFRSERLRPGARCFYPACFLQVFAWPFCRACCHFCWICTPCAGCPPACSGFC